MSFDKLKKSRSSSMNKLLQAAEKMGGGNQKKSYGDDRQWKPTRDKSGNGYAVIRFLPPADGEDLPWVQYWDHGFQGPGGWYIEKSLTSIGQQDPVSEYNSQLWNSGNEEDKELARKQKRRLHYVANVLVVSDPANPENEGQVKLYTFGKKIFDKIMDKMQPEFADEEPMNPFDFWEGADFKIKIRQISGYPNYDSSEFAAQTELFEGDDSAKEEVYNKLYKLSEFTDPSSYKSYDELKKKLDRVLGGSSTPMTTAESIELDEPAPAPVAKAKPEPVAEAVTTADDDDDEDDDDTLSYFAKLANDD